MTTQPLVQSAPRSRQRPSHFDKAPAGPRHGKDLLKLRIHQAILLIVVIVPLLGTGLAIHLLWNRLVGWGDIVLMVVAYLITGLGITIGYHRYLTHRSFETSTPIKALLLIAGSMGLEGEALIWAANHIKHHALADEEGDPHSPVEGFFHAHLGWMFDDRHADPEVYCKAAVNDPVIRFISRTFGLWAVLSLVIPFAIGGWTGLLWGGLVRIFLMHHVTWSVNSICHTFGRQDYATRDRSTNQWIVGFLALGEGWHNNHHAFPRSAFHGLRWWQFDLSAYIIRILERLGLVWSVYRVPPELEARKRLT